MICHAPPARIHVCVIRNLSVLTSAPSPLGPRGIDSIVVERDLAGYLNGELLDRVRVESDTL